MSEIVGGLLLVELTVSTNVSAALSTPSLTVTVIKVTPNWPDAGVTVTVRFEPLPPNTMLAAGTRLELVDAPATAKLAAAVSTSPMVKASGLDEVPWAIDQF